MAKPNIVSTGTRSAKTAYFGLEDRIHDLLIMAQIASEQVHACVGDLMCVDGEPKEAPTAHNVQAALFATSHVIGMMKKLRDDYESGFEDIRQGAVQ